MPNDCSASACEDDVQSLCYQVIQNNSKTFHRIYGPLKMSTKQQTQKKVPKAQAARVAVAPATAPRAARAAVKAQAMPVAQVMPVRQAQPKAVASKTANNKGTALPAGPLKREAERDVRKTINKFARHNTRDTHLRGMNRADDFEQPAKGGERIGAFHVSQTSVGARVTGMELVNEIAVDGDVSIGTVIDAFKFNPLAVGVRLPVIAQNFTRWKLDAAALLYVAGTPPVDAEGSGIFVFGVNFDPTAPLPQQSLAGAQALAAAWPNAAETSPWRDRYLRLKLDDDTQNELYVSTAGEDRLLYQFQAIMQAQTALNAGAQAYGAWYVFYDIQLTEPVINNPVATPFVAGYSRPMELTSSATTFEVGFSPAFVAGDSTFHSFLGNYPDPNAAATADPDASQLVGDSDFYRVTEEGKMVVPPGWYSLYIDTRCATTDGTSADTVTVNLPPGVLSNKNFETGLITERYTQGAVAGTTITLSLWAGLTTPAYFAAETGDACVCACAPEYRGSFLITEETEIWLKTPGITVSAGNPLVAMYFLLVRQGDAEEKLAPGGFLSTPGPRVVNAALRDKIITQRRIRAVKQLLLEEQAMCPEYYAAARAFLTDVEMTRQPPPTMTLILPQLAAIAAWFVTRYGPRLGKAACDWAVKRLERKMKEK